MPANIDETALSTMVQGINAQVSSQLLEEISEQAGRLKEEIASALRELEETLPLENLRDLISPIQPERVLDLANPLTYEIIKVHEAGDLANSPVAFITLIWIGSILGAVVLYLSGKDRKYKDQADQVKFYLLQSILPFIYGIVGAYIAAWYSTWIFGFSYASFHQMALYLALAITSFIVMIFATLRFFGLPSLAIYIILMFFSMPALQLPREMMQTSTVNICIPYPSASFGDGLRDLLFYSHSLWNSYSWILVGILHGQCSLFRKYH